MAALLLPAALTVPADPAAAVESVPSVAPATPVHATGAGRAETAAPLRAVAVAAQGTQEDLRTIVTKEVSVGRTESTLRLEFADGDVLSAGIREGVVAVDGREIGRVSAGSELDSAWRELLGRAVALENGPLARELVDWAPPANLAEGTLDAARELDRALEERLRQTASSAAVSDPAPPGERGARAVARLLARSDRLVELATILENVDLDNVRVHVDEDVEIDEGEEVAGSLLVVDGDVEVRGTVLGDVVVVGGTIRTHSGSRVDGDVRLSDARLIDRGGDVEGRIVRGEDGRASLEREIRERVQEELGREVGRFRVEREAPAPGFWDGVLRPFRWVLGGFADLVGNLLRMLLLAAIGMAVVAFGRENLEVVADAARRSPGRAAMVGVAGSFLILPVWVLGIVALAISIIGIPVLIAWLPLFPLAVALALAFGYFAFAHNVGEWLAARRFRYLEWIRSSNAHTLVVGGILALMAPFLLSDLVQMFGPLLNVLQGILVALGIGLMVFATMVGFGAVLLTRAGRRPDQYGGGGDPFDNWDWRPSPRPSPGTGGAGRSASTTGTGSAGAGRSATGTSGPEASAGTEAPHGSRGSTGAAGSAGPGASEAPGGGPAGTGASSSAPDPHEDGGEESR